MAARRTNVTRRWVLAGGAALGVWPAWAVQQAALDNPLQLGCDEALFQSGLVQAWQKAFAADTGVVVRPVPHPATRVLQLLERGEVAMSLTNLPEQEALLDKQGLAHDRRRVASGGFVVVGPVAVAKALRGAAAPATPAARRAAAPAVSLDVVMLLQALASAQVPFLSRADESGTHRLEQGLWQVAQLTPAAPWYRPVQGEAPVWLQARDAEACTLVERGVWARVARQQSGLVVLAERDAALQVDIQAMRSFRVGHPAAKLFSQWVSGPAGQRVAAQHPGYTAPRA